jgi:hypothetical protein
VPHQQHTGHDSPCETSPNGSCAAPGQPAIPECLHNACALGCTTECRAVINAAWRHLNPAAAERADQEQRNRSARAFNAVAPALKAHDQWLPLSVRQAVAEAVLSAVDADHRRQQYAEEAQKEAGQPAPWDVAWHEGARSRDRDFRQLRDLLGEAVDWIHEGELRDRITAALDRLEKP